MFLFSALVKWKRMQGAEELEVLEKVSSKKRQNIQAVSVYLEANYVGLVHVEGFNARGVTTYPSEAFLCVRAGASLQGRFALLPLPSQTSL